MAGVEFERVAGETVHSGHIAALTTTLKLAAVVNFIWICFQRGRKGRGTRPLYEWPTGACAWRRRFYLSPKKPRINRTITTAPTIQIKLFMFSPSIYRSQGASRGRFPSTTCTTAHRPGGPQCVSIGQGLENPDQLQDLVAFCFDHHDPVVNDRVALTVGQRR